MIELEPFGVTNGMERARPLMLFREKGGEAVLPVWLSPLDAGIALTQHNVQAFAISPHDVTLKVLGSLGITVKSCRFCEVKGHQQYVELKFSVATVQVAGAGNGGTDASGNGGQRTKRAGEKQKVARRAPRLRIRPMKFRADHAVSFCLQAKAKFYCTREFLETCREMDAALESLHQSLRRKPGTRSSDYPYMN